MCCEPISETPSGPGNPLLIGTPGGPTYLVEFTLDAWGHTKGQRAWVTGTGVNELDGVALKLIAVI